MIFEAVREIEDEDELFKFLCEEIQMKGRHKEVMKKCTIDEVNNFLNGRYERTLLHLAMFLKKSEVILLKLIEIGGRELVIEKDGLGVTSLHCACSYNASIEVVSKLIEIGGEDLVIQKDEDGLTSLHRACRNNAAIEVVSKLIEIGTRELLIEKDNYGSTALHRACDDEGQASVAIVLKLVMIGGRELVTEKNILGYTALHCACRNYASIEVMSKLIEIGGRELVMEKDEDGLTALHHACGSIEIVSKLIEIGGRELLVERNANGHIALFHSYFSRANFFPPRPYDDSFTLMVKEGIMAHVGGEFGIGGIFNCVDSNDDQAQILNEWENFAPSLQAAINTTHHQYQQHPPILHAAILAGAPKRIITDIINRFEWCFLTEDSLDRYPINVAIEKELAWQDGMEEVIDATAIAQQRPIITIAAQYGLKWNNHMSELAESNLNEVVNERDNETGLTLFMLAAMGDVYDLNSIYGMRKMSPLFESD